MSEYNANEFRPKEREFEFSIPSLLRAIGITGVIPQVGTAINRALRAKNEIDYKEAVREATAEISGYSANVYEADGFLNKDKTFFEGLPIWMPIMLQLPGSEDLFLESAICVINQDRNIITTPIQGRDGTVKEYISNGDYELSITGIIATRKLDYPYNEVKAFKKYMEAKQPLKIVSKLTQELGIYEVVVTGWSLPYNPNINCAQYDFKCLSDTPIILR
jgi:hypothetical protein